MCIYIYIAVVHLVFWREKCNAKMSIIIYTNEWYSKQANKRKKEKNMFLLFIFKLSMVRSST